MCSPPSDIRERQSERETFAAKVAGDRAKNLAKTNQNQAKMPSKELVCKTSHSNMYFCVVITKEVYDNNDDITK